MKIDIVVEFNVIPQQSIKYKRCNFNCIKHFIIYYKRIDVNLYMLSNHKKINYNLSIFNKTTKTSYNDKCEIIDVI